MWAVLFGIIGVVLYLFSLLQILLILTCSMPLTRKLIKANVFLDQSARKIYLSNIITIVFHVIIIAAVAIPILLFASESMKIGFGCGIILAFLLSVGKLGMHQNNVTDYYFRYCSMMDKEKATLFFFTFK